MQPSEYYAVPLNNAGFEQIQITIGKADWHCEMAFLFCNHSDKAE
jgi:hypothetical protein